MLLIKKDFTHHLESLESAYAADCSVEQEKRDRRRVFSFSSIS